MLYIAKKYIIKILTYIEKRYIFKIDNEKQKIIEIIVTYTIKSERSERSIKITLGK